jgi:hypothetical protein
MKRLISVALTTTMALATSAQWVTAQTKPAAADARVKVALDKLGLKYQTDQDGDYKLIMDLGSGRSQTVLVMSGTEKLREMEVREISSLAYVSEQSLSAEVANQLLADNAKKKLGAWQVVKISKGYVAIFTAKVSATSPEELEAAVISAAKSADDMEKALTNADKF